jgi:hypothetical protein
VPRAYEDERGLRRQKMIERKPSKEKMEKKGHTNVKMKEIDSQKIFAPQIS